MSEERILSHVKRKTRGFDVFCLPRITSCSTSLCHRSWPVQAWLAIGPMLEESGRFNIKLWSVIHSSDHYSAWEQQTVHQLYKQCTTTVTSPSISKYKIYIFFFFYGSCTPKSNNMYLCKKLRLACSISLQWIKDLALAMLTMPSQSHITVRALK